MTDFSIGTMHNVCHSIVRVVNHEIKEDKRQRKTSKNQ